MNGGSPTRRRPTYVTEERELFDAWLDFHRATLMEKCQGLTDEQRKARPVQSSLLSLHGLVRHMAETERNWFGRILQRDQGIPRIWADPAVVDSPLVPLDHADWMKDLAVWQAECDASRKAAAARALDYTGRWRDKDVALRSIYLHMIQEYARHNGHSDLIRELLDGTTGL